MSGVPIIAPIYNYHTDQSLVINGSAFKLRADRIKQHTSPVLQSNNSTSPFTFAIHNLLRMSTDLFDLASIHSHVYDIDQIDVESVPKVVSIQLLQEVSTLARAIVGLSRSASPDTYALYFEPLGTLTVSFWFLLYISPCYIKLCRLLETGWQTPLFLVYPSPSFLQ